MKIIYIKHIPRDELLYALWSGAKVSSKLKYCLDLAPTLTLQRAKQDINEMIQNGRRINLTGYHGRSLFLDITDDTTDVHTYEVYNGKDSAEKIIMELWRKELCKSVMTHYKFY